MGSYSFLCFDTSEDKQAFIDAYNKYGVVRKRELKRLGVDHFTIEMEVNDVTNMLYYLENYIAPEIVPGTVVSSSLIIGKARELEKKMKLQNIISKCIVDVMDRCEGNVDTNKLIEDCCVEIVIKHSEDIDLHINEVRRMVSKLVLDSETVVN